MILYICIIRKSKQTIVQLSRDMVRRLKRDERERKWVVIIIYDAGTHIGDGGGGGGVIALSNSSIAC